MAAFERDYAPITLDLSCVAGDRGRRMRSAVDTLWRFLKDQGVSWVGFYTKVDGADEMVLGPSRDTPACSPIELHGACGSAWSKRRPIIVSDVANLGHNYIACDPRDRAELIIPLFDENHQCYGVLDLDSHQRDAFSTADLRSLKHLMETTGIGWPSAWVDPLVY